MKKRPLLIYGGVFVFIAAVLIAVFGFHVVKGIFIKRYFAKFTQPPVTVSATKAREVRWYPYVTSIASLSSVNGVNVSGEVAGTVVNIAFHSGEAVKAGQLLVKLNDSEEKALLHQYQAQEVLNKLNYQRAVELRKQNLNSIQSLDQAHEQYAVSQAQVASEQAVIAKLHIRAPFPGIVGIRQVNLGQYLAAGTEVVNLEQLAPLYVDFSLPQDEAPRVHVGQTVLLTVSAYGSETFKGQIHAINPAVTVQSRTLDVQAIIPNKGEKLRPGMYADVKVLGDAPIARTVVPVPAITYSLYGDSVYVLTPRPTKQGAHPKTDKGKAKHKQPTVYVAKQVFVKIGQTRGNWISVTGLKPGELVVTAGQIKLRSGNLVTINNTNNPVAVPKVLTP